MVVKKIITVSQWRGGRKSGRPKAQMDMQLAMDIRQQKSMLQVC